MGGEKFFNSQMLERSMSFKCKICGCKLEPWEGHALNTTMAGQWGAAGVKVPSAGVDKFCDECWEKKDEVY
jgi:hypothetical protein